MHKVLIYSLLLIAGLAGSQMLPGLVGAQYDSFGKTVTILTMICLSYVMIRVGQEFDIDKSRWRDYGWDYVVAATAAAFPWIFCAVYFVGVLSPEGSWSSWDAWKESLLTSRFAAPTSAGVLFSMLAAAGLAATWLYRKARILAIFDDLDTVLLMIPLKMLIVGLQPALLVTVVFMGAMIWVAWRWMHAIALPTGWSWVLLYAALITGFSELVYFATAKTLTMPLHLEVLLPAFALGCVLKADPEHAHGTPADEKAGNVISAAFMLLVGLSMPLLSAAMAGASMSYSTLAFHVVLITVLSNLGKMYPAFCYRNEASWRERLALAIGMWPRGEVGAGVLVVSLSYGIAGPAVAVAMLSLALNLLLTGVFIFTVRKLLDAPAEAESTTPGPQNISKTVPA